LSRSSTNFDSLTVVLDQPSKGPGWGYAMKRTGVEVDPVVATNVLKDFEKGDISLDRMFKNLNVELVEKPNGDGVKMIKRCKVILMRANGGDAWKIRTHYPDDQLNKANLGWESERNQAKGDVTFKKGGVLTVIKNSAVP